MTLLQPGQTEHILLRTPEESDIADLVKLWSDPQVTAHLGGPRKSADVVRHFGELVYDPYGFAAEKREWWWCVICRETGRLAGLGSLVTRAVVGFEEVDVAYYLFPWCWGQGYAAETCHILVTYAFEELELESVVAVMDPANAGSIAVADKMGFVHDGTFTRGDGELRAIYRLRRQDWRPDSKRK